MLDKRSCHTSVMVPEKAEIQTKAVKGKKMRGKWESLCIGKYGGSVWVRQNSAAEKYSGTLAACMALHRSLNITRYFSVYHLNNII